MIRNFIYLKSVGTLMCEDTFETFAADSKTQLFFLNENTVCIDDELLGDCVQIEDVCDEWLNSLSGEDALQILILTVKTVRDNE
jgi:hypothetical protein